MEWYLERLGSKEEVKRDVGIFFEGDSKICLKVKRILGIERVK